MENRPFNDTPAQVNQTFLETGDALIALAARTAHVDRVVTEAAYTLLLADSGAPFGPGTARVGGGRLRPPPLFPAFRYRSAAAVRIRAAVALDGKTRIAAFLQQLWDSDLRVSHSVRTGRRVHRSARAEHRAEHQPSGPALPGRRPRVFTPRWPKNCRVSWAPTAIPSSAIWRASRASATPSSPIPSTTWSPTSRRPPAACAIFSSCAGSSSSAAPPTAANLRRSRTPSFSWRGCAATCTANRAATIMCFPSRPRIRWPPPATPPP